MPPGVNPAGCDPWGLDSFQLFPNFVILIWGQGWYLTYHYWPTSHNTHIFEGNVYFVPAEDARERVAQEMAAVTFKEYALQDANTLEATQTMLESRVVDRVSRSATRRSCAGTCTRWPADWVDDYARRPRGGRDDRLTPCCPSEFADLEPFAAKWCLPTRARALRRSGWPARWPRCRRSTTPSRPAPRRRSTYCDQFPLDDLPEDAANLLHLLYSMIMVSFPVEAWRQPRVPDTGAAALDCVVEPVP